jgi:hypothetical protein
MVREVTLNKELRRLSSSVGVLDNRERPSGTRTQMAMIRIFATVVAIIPATHHVTLGPLVSSGHGTSCHIWGQVFLKADFVTSLSKHQKLENYIFMSIITLH